MDAQSPTLEPGLTCLVTDDAPAALYRLLGRHLEARSGPAYWVDARNAAAPPTLRRHAGERACRSLRVARAFTGYQHHELVRALPGRVRPTAALVVAPHVDALYAEDDHETDPLLDATLALLGELADALSVPVLVTADRYGERVRGAADRTLSAAGTDAGLRVEGPSFRTDVYWDGRGFQTTIPYWVDLLGAASTVTRWADRDPAVAGV